MSDRRLGAPTRNVVALTGSLIPPGLSVIPPGLSVIVTNHRLITPDRSVIANDRRIASLDEPTEDASVEAAWLAEVERRLEDVDRGSAKLEAWDVVRERIAAHIRAPRS